jgi:Flp pilus assembly protein TadB
VQTSLRGWTGRRRPTGVVGGLFFLAGAAVVLLVLTVLAALGLIVMALVGLLIGAERLLGLLVPAYRRRRRERYLTMPARLFHLVRFGSGPSHVIDARSFEVPSER